MYQTLKQRMIHSAIHHPKRIIWAMAISTLIITLTAALPTLWPDQLPGLHSLKIDTDPENMLAEDEPVRVFHNNAKQRFNLHDMIVVGVTNPKHPQGAYNKDTLARVFRLTEFAQSLQWPNDEGRYDGVVSIDLVAPSTVDNIEQGGLGSVDFSWLMAQPPEDDQAALAILQKAQRIPFLNGTLVSENGKALALYLPITSKDQSYRIRNELLEFTRDWQNHGDEIHITGLPVAEDTFGVEMFIQMAISAPLAMLLIFLLLWWFFKKLILVASPMILAMVCSLSTMGLLIISGNTLHIMSSMIPIFIMPIAVLDAVHILSEFFDSYPKFKDRRKTIEHVLNELFAPMLFTTLTTMAGFASLMLTPIPPVQVFGLYIAIGVFLAWLWTMLFIPAYIMNLSEERLEGYGATGDDHDASPLSRLLRRIAPLSHRKPRVIIVGALLLAVIAGYGIQKINVNDNPTRWFEASHPIRQADRVLNENFGGTYMAYLELSAPADNQVINPQSLSQLIEERQQLGIKLGNAPLPYQAIQQRIADLDPDSNRQWFEQLRHYVDAQRTDANDANYYSWDDLQLLLDETQLRGESFKQPQVLEWLEGLQSHMFEHPVVGKVNSLPDIVKTVYRELQLGDAEQFKIPHSANAVGQTLITYQNSHRPHDLWHFVTPDYRRSVLWLQLTSGDNQDMEQVIAHFNRYMERHPPPQALASNWFGLTYINVIWQGKMVNGMLEAFLGSFVIVLLMMTLLFRSLAWGMLAMIPLSLTVGLIYGIIGLIGKDYDMPVAVLSALSLGLAVDYAIHFLARARSLVNERGSWSKALPLMFDEPARAISRNAIVLAVGFTPLLLAPLVPYQTVGIFIATIIVCAAMATLLILPAALTLLSKQLFGATTETRS